MARRALLGLIALVVVIFAASVAVLPAAAASPDAPPRQDGSDDAPPPEPLAVHIVQRGETLMRIAVNYGVPMSSIVVANGIANPSHIETGQRLVIPASAADAEAMADSGVQVRHVVQAGDILSRIAEQYGVSAAAITQANGIVNPSHIEVGEVLVIPGAAAPAAEPEAAPEPAEDEQPEPQAEADLPDAPVEDDEPPQVEEPEPVNEASPPDPTVDDKPVVRALSPYTVQRGDTLFKIALQYGVSMADIMVTNGLANADRIDAGQLLQIPAAGDGLLPVEFSDNAPESPIDEGKQILVRLSDQRVFAYEDGELLREFIVSTGLPGTPTVQGDYSIYIKYTSQRMVGPGYDLPGVPYVMYFYQGYGLHGTYWHNNFGHPMSHGCVNLRTPEAQWLYDWAPLGTPVRVIY